MSGTERNQKGPNPEKNGGEIHPYGFWFRFFSTHFFLTLPVGILIPALYSTDGLILAELESGPR
jgi:hypothetical protein